MNPVSRVLSGAFTLCAASLALAQTAPPAQPAEPPKPIAAERASQQKAKEHQYVRRFSAGLSVSVVAKPAIADGTYDAYDATNTVLTSSSTMERNHRMGAGLQVQATLFGHYAVNVGAIYRETGYFSKTTYLTGTDNPNTVIDERKKTIFEQKTKLAYYDFPVLARYYVKHHADPGPRYFFELGGTVRKAARITSDNVQVDPTAKVTVNTTPVKPSKSMVLGYTGGFGVHLEGPFGIRFVPGIRYTRWTGMSFNTLSTVSNRQQIEGMFSFTF